MCGIIGKVLTNQGTIVSDLLTPLKKLEYRGYDSCGYFALGEDGASSSHRVVGDVKHLMSPVVKEKLKITRGIAHTRWATHGAVTSGNSHPQVSGGRVYVVHNGVIDNFHELKTSLIIKGYSFESETDTEVIAHLIHFYVSVSEIKYTTATAVCMAMMDLKGKFSFIVLDAETGSMVMANSGRPLIAFRNPRGIMIASDVAAFTGEADGEIYYTKDNEVCEIGEISTELMKVSMNGEKALCGFSPYSPEPELSIAKMRTVMEAEIHQQPAAVANTLRAQPPVELKQMLSGIARQGEPLTMHLIGCGTSYHAALLGARWMKLIAGIDAYAHVSSEFSLQGMIGNSEERAFVFLSQSGETADTLTALETVNAYASHRTIAICNTPQSELVRGCQYPIITRAGVETSVASTKAFSCQLVALLKTAIALGRITKSGMGSISFILDDVENSLSKIKDLYDIATGNNSIVAKAFAESLNPKRAPSYALFIGRDTMYPIVMEGALKLAEIAYIPSIPYYTGELKHGPLALVDNKTPVVAVFSSREPDVQRVFSSLNQVQSRGGRIILVSDAKGVTDAKSAGISPLCEFVIPLPERYETIFETMLAIVPLQLLAHEIAVKLKRDVDRPRNLAKSVTIE